MAFYVSVPRDLSRVKTKVFLNLTKRQLICFSLAAGVGFPVYFLVKEPLGTSTASLVMVMAMMPLFLMAMYEKNGKPMEVLLFYYMESRFLRPRVRIYRTENLFRDLEMEKGILDGNLLEKQK